MKKLKMAKMKDKKVRGEWAEMKFMTSAAEHGLCVSKPWGDSNSYDFVVGRPGHFVAVQVKCTVFNTANGVGYVCSVCSSHKQYRRGSFDFLAAYLVCEDAWYIIPEKEIRGKWSISLRTECNHSRYEKYLEAWDLLRRPEFTGDIQACTEEFPAEYFLPLFRGFPQRSSVLHSLCTAEDEFSVARSSFLEHSTASANVRCLESAVGLR